MIDFNKLHWGQIDTLCSVLLSTSTRNIQTVQRRYKTESTNYRETLNFLIELGLLKIHDNDLKLSGDFSKAIKLKENSLRLFFIKTLFHDKSNFINYFGDFFDNFELLDNLYRFIPNTQDRLKYSSVRNFLISIGVLHFEPNYSGYTATKELIVYLQNKKRILSYSEFIRKIKAQEEIGLAAEELIYNKEKSKFRSIPDLKNNIIHISKVNVRAGYDIRSFEMKGKNRWVTKYIEVKVVSENDWRFYWSKNEINKAKQFGKKYYLYLLPVKRRNVLNLAKLRQIKNPYNNVFQNSRDWLREIENTAFYNNK